MTEDTRRCGECSPYRNPVSFEARAAFSVDGSDLERVVFMLYGVEHQVSDPNLRGSEV
jgi:hypothetical protein